MSTETTKVETTEFEDGSQIVETTTIESEYIEGESSAETIAEAVEEIAEEITGENDATVSDAVAIAEIEAERDITIAAIQAETTTAIIEAESERELSWQEVAAELRTNMQELAAQIANLSAVQAAPSTPEPSTEVTAETVEEVTIVSTPQSTLDLTSETPMEVIQESADEKPEVPAPRPVRLKRRLI